MATFGYGVPQAVRILGPQDVNEEEKRLMRERGRNTRPTSGQGLSYQQPSGKAGLLDIAPEGMEAPEPESIGQQALNAGLYAGGKMVDSGIGLANVLDVPGSVVRDVVSWLPGGPAPANPLDQLLPWNWASSDKRVSEEEILEGYGLYDSGPAENRGIGTSIGRFAGELALGVALDPLTYLTGGATAVLKGVGRGAKAARAISKAGLLDNVAVVASKKAGKAGSVGPREAFLKTTARDVIEDSDLVEEGKRAAAAGSKYKSWRAAVEQEAAKRGETLSEADIEKLLDSPLSESPLDFKLPFTEWGHHKPLKEGGKLSNLIKSSLGVEDPAASYARGVDKIGSAIRYSGPVRRAATVFDKRMKGRLSKDQQMRAIEEAKLVAENQGAARELIYGAVKKIEDSGVFQEPGKILSDAMESPEFSKLDKAGQEALLADKRRDQVRIGNMMYRYLEDIGRQGRKQAVDEDTGKFLGYNFDEPAEDFAKRPEFEKLRQANLIEPLNTIKRETDHALRYATETGGVPIEGFQDPYASFAARAANLSDKVARTSSSKAAYNPTTESAIQRAEYLRDAPGGTTLFQEMSIDEDIAGNLDPDFLKGLKSKPSENALFDLFKEKYQKALGWEDKDKRLKDLFDSIARRPKEHVLQQIPMFEVNPAVATLRNLENLYRSGAEGVALRKAIAEEAKVARSASDWYGSQERRVRVEGGKAFGKTPEDLRKVEVGTGVIFRLLDKFNMSHAAKNIRVERASDLDVDDLSGGTRKGGTEPPDIDTGPPRGDGGGGGGGAPPDVEPPSPSPAAVGVPEGVQSKVDEIIGSEPLFVTGKTANVEAPDFVTKGEPYQLPAKPANAMTPEELDKYAAPLLGDKKLLGTMSEAEKRNLIRGKALLEALDAGNAMASNPAIVTRIAEYMGHKPANLDSNEIIEKYIRPYVDKMSRPAQAAGDPLADLKKQANKILKSDKGVDAAETSAVIDMLYKTGDSKMQELADSIAAKAIDPSVAMKNRVGASRKAQEKVAKVTGQAQGPGLFDTTGKPAAIEAPTFETTGKAAASQPAAGQAQRPGLFDTAEKKAAATKEPATTDFVTKKVPLAERSLDDVKKQAADLRARLQFVKPGLVEGVKLNAKKEKLGEFIDRAESWISKNQGLIDKAPKNMKELRGQVKQLRDDLKRSAPKMFEGVNLRTIKRDDLIDLRNNAMDFQRRYARAEKKSELVFRKKQVVWKRWLSKRAEQMKQTGREMPSKSEREWLWADLEDKRRRLRREFEVKYGMQRPRPEADKYEVVDFQKYGRSAKGVADTLDLMRRGASVRGEFDKADVFREHMERIQNNYMPQDFIDETEYDELKRFGIEEPTRHFDAKLNSNLETPSYFNELARKLWSKGVALRKSGKIEESKKYVVSMKRAKKKGAVKGVWNAKSLMATVLDSKEGLPVYRVWKNVLDAYASGGNLNQNGMDLIAVIARNQPQWLEEDTLRKMFPDMLLGKHEVSEAGQEFLGEFEPIKEAIAQKRQVTQQGLVDKISAPTKGQQARVSAQELRRSAKEMGLDFEDINEAEAKDLLEHDEFVSDEQIANASSNPNLVDPETGKQVSIEDAVAVKQKGLFDTGSQVTPESPSFTTRVTNREVAEPRTMPGIASIKLGMIDDSVVARSINSAMEGYEPVLGSAADDFAAAVDESFAIGSTLEEVVSKNTPFFTKFRETAAKNGKLEEVMGSIKAYDSTVRALNKSASASANTKVLKHVMDYFEIDGPDDPKEWLNSIYGIIEKRAKEFSDGGQGASADIARIALNPLNDSKGRFLGSDSIDDYPMAEVIARQAELARGKSFVDDYPDYDNIEELLSDKPELFPKMVDLVRKHISMGDNPISFGVDDTKSTTFYNRLSYDLPDEIDVPFFYNKVTQRLEGISDNATADPNMFVPNFAKDPQRWRNTLGVTADEIEDLGLVEFFAGGPRTVGQLKQHILENTPTVRVVNAGSGGHYRYFDHAIPGGDPNSYFEIIGTLPRRAGGDVTAKHYQDHKNPVFHWRANSYVDQDGNKILRIQEVQRQKAVADVLPFKRSYGLLAMKSALHVAAENGFDGIALVDGRDAARAVNYFDSIKKGDLEGYKGLEQTLGRVYMQNAKRFDKYVQDLGASPGVEDYVPGGRVAGPDPDSLKLVPTAKNAWVVGRSGTGEITIQYIPEDGMYVVTKEGVVDDRVYADSLDEAKEIAAEDLEKLPDGTVFHRPVSQQLATNEFGSVIARDNPGGWNKTVTKWMLNDDARRQVLGGQSLYKTVDGDKRASITFPGTDPESWHKSNMQTIIRAADAANGKDFLHEIMHLFRMSLRDGDPQSLSDLEGMVARYAVNPDSVRKNDGSFNWKAQANHWTGKPMSRDYTIEELFADMGAHLIDNGSESSDGVLQKFSSRLKQFVARVFKAQKAQGLDKDFPPDLDKWLTDTIGEKRWEGSMTVSQALSKTKYTNPRAVMLLKDDIDRNTWSQAEDVYYEDIIRDIREETVNDMVAAGEIDAARTTPLNDQEVEDFFNKLRSERQNSASNGTPMPKEINGIKLIDESKPDDVRKVLTKLELGPDVANDLTLVYGISEALKDPNVIDVFNQYLDAYTNVFKTNVTAIAPQFHVRNLFSGMIQNMLNGAVDPWAKGASRFFQPYKDANYLITNRVIEDADKIISLRRNGKALSSEEATEEIRKMVFKYKLLDSPGQTRDLAGLAGEGQRIADTIPGAEGARSLKELVKIKATPREWMDWWENANPFAVAGGFKSLTKASKTDRFIMSRYGRAVGDVVEAELRVGPFIALLKQGYDPAEAARRVKLLQVDYSDLTKVEREVLRRYFPFYGFTKGMSKYMFNELTTRPGGPVAQSMRAANIARDPDEATPEYITKSLAVPLGAGKGGSRQYLTGLGLMHEGVMDDISQMPFLGGSVGEGLYQWAGKLNPLVKSVGELATNESLYFADPKGGGRSLDDLDPLVGRTLANITGGGIDSEPYRVGKLTEALVTGSPVAKLLYTARTATDPRKGTLAKLSSTLTGFRVSSVSPASQDAVLRERAAELMQQMGGKSFERVYFTDKQLEAMSPERRQVAEEYMEIMRMLANRAKTRKSMKEAANG